MKKIILAVMAVLICSARVFSADTENFTAMQKNFIRLLYNQKRYFDSIAEARRLQVEDKSPELDYFIYMNYYFAEQYRTVVTRYDYTGSHLGLCAGFLVSESYLKLGMYDESIMALSVYKYSGIRTKDMQLFLRRAVPLVLSGDLAAIENEKKIAEPFLHDDYNFTSLREELDRFREAGLKSPLKGAFLSALIPGLGQVYSGYIGEGIVSFASVAATALGGVYLRNNGREGDSYPLFFFSGLFYAGNIYGGWNSAERRNRSTLIEEYRVINSRYGVYTPEECIDMDGLLR